MTQSNPLGVGDPRSPGMPNAQPTPPGVPPLRDSVDPAGNPPAARTSLDAAKALPNPGDVVLSSGTNTPPSNVEVQTPEDRDERLRAGDPNRDFNAEREALNREEQHRDTLMKKYRGTPLGDHPPLKKGDKIQGPYDRTNREPTEDELAHGEFVTAFQDKPEYTAKEHEPNDPPIDESAPKDVPADPRKVAESRGMIGDAPPKPFDPSKPPVDTSKESSAEELLNA